MENRPVKTTQRFINIIAKINEYPIGFMLFIVLSMLIPRFYRIINVYWVGHIDYSALAIAEQYEFIGIIIEIVNESIPFGILALVSQHYKKREKIIEQLKTGVLLQLFFSILFTSIIFFNINSFVDLIGTEIVLVDQTVRYLRIRALALPFESLAMLLILGLKSMDRPKVAVLAVTGNVIFNIFLDILLVSNISFSLQWGLQGVAWGFLLSNILFFLTSLTLTIKTLNLKKDELGLTNTKNDAIHLFGIGGWTGIDSLVRNMFYFVTLQVLNFLGSDQYAGFQLFQMIMWTVLIPVIALSQGTSIRVGNYLEEKNAKEKILSVLVVSSTLAFAFISLFGVLGLFSIDRLGYTFTNNPNVVYYSSTMFYWQIIPYILFAASMNIRSIFYGTGKTKNILIVSLILNLGVIFPFFLMMDNGIIAKSFASVMLMFVFVDFIDFIVTILLARRTYSKLSSYTIKVP